VRDKVEIADVTSVGLSKHGNKYIEVMLRAATNRQRQYLMSSEE
jgi:hypothetical protein